MPTYCLSVTGNMKNYSLSVIYFIAKSFACFKFPTVFAGIVIALPVCGFFPFCKGSPA